MTPTERLAAAADALLSPFADPASRTFWPLLLIGFAVAVLVEARRTGTLRGAAHLWSWRTWTSPSSRLDALLLATRQLGLLALAPALGATWGLATAVARGLDDVFGVPAPPPVSAAAFSALYTAALFVAWDASRYAVHRALHAIPALWAFHQVHHSATTLTPLTFHRVHPVESLLMGLRGVLVTGVLTGLAFWWARDAAVQLTILGVHAAGLVCNAISGNLRHSHAWWRWGALERWLLSPAQHQLHHNRDRAWQSANYGTWLALWDRLGGTWRPAPEAPQRDVGLHDADLNHDPTRLVSALFAPLRPSRRAAAVAAALALTTAARAEDPPDTHADPPDPAFDDDTYEIVVVEGDGMPRVAGSAHVLDEAELQRHNYDDVHRILQSVPGVYIRTEDGFGLRPNIGMRGANSDRSAKILLMEDGVPLAPAPYAAPAAYYFPLVTRMTGLEVIKGPAAIRFGPQTIGGAINLVTRKVPTAPTLGVDASGGSFGTLRGHVYAGTGNDHVGVLAEVAHISSAGFQELDTGGPTGFSRQDVMLKARAGAASGADGHVVELKLGYGREHSASSYLGLSVDDFAVDPYRRYAASDGDAMDWDRYQAELSHKLAVGATHLRTVAYVHQFHRAWDKFEGFASGVDVHGLLLDPDPSGQAATYLAILRGDEDTATPDQVILKRDADRTFTALGVASRLRADVDTGALSHGLELGLRAHVDLVHRVHSETSWEMRTGQLERVDADPVVSLDTQEDAYALAAHVHDDISAGPVHVLPGVRVEAIRTTVDGGEPVDTVIPLPGLGTFVRATGWLDVLGGVHRGFSPASPSNAGLVPPETAWNAEAGLRAHPAEVSLEAIGFFSAYQDLVGECTLSSGCSDDQLGQQFAGGAAWVYGVETLAGDTLHLPGRVDLRGELTYTWTHTEFLTTFRSGFSQFGDVDAGDALPYVPAHQGSATLGVDHARFGVDVTVGGRSGMRDVAGTGPLDPLAGDLPGLVTADLAAAVRPFDGWELYGTVNNVTGVTKVESWRPMGARPSAPFTALAGLRASF